MDAPDLPEADYRACLRDLAALNRMTLTHRAALRWLARASRHMEHFSVLDIAFGQGDFLRALARFGRRSGKTLRLEGIDLNPRAAIAARGAAKAAAGAGEPAIAYHTGDVFNHVPAEPPDFIFTSQFPHHLPEAGILRLLGWMERHARHGWHITDLRRDALAYHGFPALARLCRWHPIVRQDGQTSIARGFTGAEWRALLASAGLKAEVRSRVFFRHSISRLK